MDMNNTEIKWNSVLKKNEREPSELKINVLTMQSDLNIYINNIEQLAKDIVFDDNILGVSYVRIFKDNKKNIIITRGYIPYYNYKKSFPHQLTVFVCPDQNCLDHLINIKLFRNGSLQMTGCRNQEEGRIATEYIKECIYKLKNKEYITCNDKIDIKNIYISMINAICKMNFNIKLDVLTQILIDKYKLKVIFDKGVHPPAKVWFMWNKNKQIQNGHCTCKIPCNFTKKDSIDNTHLCKKITISIQHTGIIQFMGANLYKQLYDSHEFIITFMYQYYSNLIKIKN